MRQRLSAVVFDLGGTLWFSAAHRPAAELGELEAARLRPLFESWGIAPPSRLGELAAEVWLAVDEAYAAEREHCVPVAGRAGDEGHRDHGGAGA